MAMLFVVPVDKGMHPLSRCLYIAEEVGLSVPATADRIKKLQDSGVIIGFKPIIDSKKIELDITAFITVYSESSKNFEKVVANAKVNKNHSSVKSRSHQLGEA